jgi:futalosine hydrolase
MYILLAAATPFEIQPTLDILEARSLLQWDRLITGVGALATTWSLIRQIDSRRPDLIIQAGIAGSFAPLPAGETLAIKEETLGDLGVWEEGGFRTLFDLHLAEPDSLPFSGGKLVNPYGRLFSLSGLRPVAGITVNEITTDPARIAWHRRSSQQNEGPAVESMEGGALHFVALREKIPFLQIRSVSNEVGVRDKSKWEIPTAIRTLNECLVSLMDKLETAGPEVLVADPAAYNK